MRALALVAALAVAGCNGGDAQPSEAKGLSRIVVDLVDAGRRSEETFSDRFGGGDSLPSCSVEAIEPGSGRRETLAAEIGFVLSADLSPDGRSLLLARYAAGFAPLGIFLLELGSGEQRRLAQGEFGRWSPDGKRIAFDSDRHRNGLFHDCGGYATEVYVMDADGGNARRLTNDAAVDAGFDWSDDGEWILFGRIPDEEVGWDLWAVRADGACERRLIETKRWEIGAEWHGGGHGGLAS